MSHKLQLTLLDTKFQKLTVKRLASLQMLQSNFNRKSDDWCGEHTLPYMVMKPAIGKITSAYCKNKLVILTMSGYPACKQTEETVVMRALLHNILDSLIWLRDNS